MNIKENLIEIFELTKTCMDLSQLALYLNEKEIEEELEKVYEKISSLKFETEKLVFKIKEKNDVRVSILDLLDYVKEIVDASIKIKDLNKRDVHYIIKEAIKGLNERIILMKINKETNVSTGKIAQRFGIRISMIKRKGEFLFPYRKSIRLNKDDEIYIIGTDFDKDVIKELCN